MIEISNLKKVYPSHKGPMVALQDINLKIPKGKIFGIIGPSGAGKSTLIRTINMLERPTEGNIFIEGEDITQYNEKQLRVLRKQMGMIFQHFNLLTSRTVAENIAFPMEIAGVSKDNIKAKIKELLPLVGLEDKANTYVANLSGGQKQRVGIARALANNPKILLCDEATSALDPQTTEAILRLLNDINKRFGLTVILITHEMHVIKEICDAVAFIDNSRIIETNSVTEVFTNPQSTIVKDFVHSVLNGDKQKRLIEEGIIKVSQRGMLVRVSFVGQSAGEPLVSEVVRRFNVDANILFGNIDTIKETPFGTLIIELTGEKKDIEKSIGYIESKNIGIEVLHSA